MSVRAVNPDLPRVAVHTRGLWVQRASIAAILNMAPIRAYPWTSRFDAVVGWGFRSTSRRAIRTARTYGRPYIAIEDGFYRSIRPGGLSRYGWIVDREGIYYECGRPSDLESHIARRIAAPPESLDRIRQITSLIVRAKLTKYNDARLLPPSKLGLASGRDVVLVVDQTMLDASVSGAGANEQTFRLMVERAIAENPKRQIVVKRHPETVSGRKLGYLSGLEADPRVTVISESVNPWSLLDCAMRVYVVSSQLGFDAILAGLPVTCFGTPFYAGWGLTDDRAPRPARRNRAASVPQIAAAALLDYNVYLDPESLAALQIEDVLERLIVERARLLGEPVVSVKKSHTSRAMLSASARMAG